MTEPNNQQFDPNGVPVVAGVMGNDPMIAELLKEAEDAGFSSPHEFLAYLKDRERQAANLEVELAESRRATPPATSGAPRPAAPAAVTQPAAPATNNGDLAFVEAQWATYQVKVSGLPETERPAFSRQQLEAVLTNKSQAALVSDLATDPKFERNLYAAAAEYLTFQASRKPASNQNSPQNTALLMSRGSLPSSGSRVPGSGPVIAGQPSTLDVRTKHEIYRNTIAPRSGAFIPKA